MPRELIYKDEARKAIMQTNDMFAYCIDRVKPVDAVEVVHGRWIHRPDERRCPFCGYHYSYFGGKDYNYCPNCGAKMDGDGNG